MRKKKKNNLKPAVVSFRLTAAQNRLLSTTFENTPMSYVKSKNALARKVVCDYLAGRFKYKEAAHAALDVDAHAATAAAA